MAKIPAEHQNRYFYHFTHIDNIQSIIEHGILSTNQKEDMGINHVNVASKSIQMRRSKMNVSCGPKGCVHDYVPFYFCSRNPMFLSLVNSKNVDQNDVVILAIPIERILEDHVVFTDASANTTEPPNFYSEPTELANLNWNEIDSQKWSCDSDDLRHQKMAEVLIHKEVPLNYVEYIIVWNDNTKKKVKEIFEEMEATIPQFSYSKFGKHNFFYSKFMVIGQENELLVTGPRVLRERYEYIVRELIKNKSQTKEKKFQFENVEDCLVKLRKDFCLIEELKGIFELETDNDVHSENVSDHTLNVIKNLKGTDFFKNASLTDKRILELSAYLHDIGKGPAKKWRTGKQPAYPDHPADAAYMVARVLDEDIKDLSEYEIRMICLLVIYHDLIGEIFSKHRDPKQLVDVITTENDFDMLATLNKADVEAINWIWAANYNSRIATFKEEILKQKGLK